MPLNRPYPGKNDQKLTIFTLARFSERIFKILDKSLLEGANAYLLPQTGSRQLLQFSQTTVHKNVPQTDRQTNRQRNRHTDEINNVRFRRYVCINFANFLLRKKYIDQLNYTFINLKLNFSCTFKRENTFQNRYLKKKILSIIDTHFVTIYPYSVLYLVHVLIFLECIALNFISC